jgi:hypothetical protein
MPGRAGRAPQTVSPGRARWESLVLRVIATRTLAREVRAATRNARHVAVLRRAVYCKTALSRSPLGRI